MIKAINLIGKVLGAAILVAVLGGQARAQQAFTYSQYMNNLTPINPAYSLIDKAGSMNALVSKKWAGIPGSPTTFIFNGNLPIESMGASAGLLVSNDQFAVEHLTKINGFFAKSIKLAENHYLGVSINAGIRRYVANYSSLSATDPAFKNDIRENKPDFGFGILYYSDHYYLGASVPQLTTRTLGDASRQGSASFRNQYNFTGAYLFGKQDDDVRVKPSVLATYAKEVPFVMDFSTIIYFKGTLGLGADYRTNTEMAGVLSYSSDAFKFGYSYQFGTASNNVSRFSNTTHEITLTYRFGDNLKDRSLL
jgi:type IX secretion system PorP/SprF family membrane protein